MLTKIDLLVLGIIAEKPINPYAVIKLINFKRNSIRRYVPPQSVYGTINALKKKRLITGHKQKNGNRPDKTVYSITNNGEKMIKRILKTYLNTPEDTLSDMVLSILLIGFLEKETVLNALEEYREKTVKEIFAIQELSKKIIIPEKQYTRKIVGGHTLKMLQLNLKTVNKLNEMVKADADWGSFTVPWWRDEYLLNKEKGVSEQI